MTRPLSSLVLVVLLLASGSIQAHHGQILRALSRVIKTGEFDRVRAVFTDEVWNGQKGDVAGKELHGLRKSARRTAFSTGETNRKGMVMAMQFFTKGRREADWIFAIAHPAAEPIVVEVEGHRYACRWRITRLTRSRAEAEKFFGRPLKYGRPRPSAGKNK